MANILEHNHIQGNTLLNSVTQNLDYDHAIYHDRSGDGGDSYSPDIGGFAWSFESSEGQHYYGLFYMNDLDINEVHVLLGSPYLIRHSLSSIQHTD